VTAVNPLVAERQDSTSFWAGTGIGEDLSDLSEAIGNGSWVYGSLAGVGLVGDVVFTVFNPIAAAVSAGMGWLIEHIDPLDKMLEQLTGDADAVMAGAQTWTNISEALTTHAQEVRDYVTADMADQAGLAADAWRSRAKELSDGLDGASGAAAGIAKGLQIAAAIVQFVHDMVRDTITEAFGMLIQAAAEEFFSLGLLTPLVAYQTYSWIATRVARLSGKIKDLVTSISALSRLLSRVPPGLTGMVGKLKKLKKLAPSNLAEATGRGIGRTARKHMGGSPEAPAHAGAARAARSANNLDSLGGTSTHTPAGDAAGSAGGPGSAGGSSGGRSVGGSGGASAGSGPGSAASGSGLGASGSGGASSGSGSPGSTYHGLDPIHGDISKPPTSGHGGEGLPTGSASSSPLSSHADTGGGAGGSASGWPGSTGGAGTPGTSSGGGSSAGNNSYHGIDPIHGDTRAPSSASSAAHADAGSTSGTGSGPDGGRTRTPDVGTSRAGSGSDPAKAADLGSASGTHAGDGAGPQSSRDHAPDSEAPEAVRPDSEHAPGGDRPDTQRTSDNGGGKSGSDSEPEPTSRNGSGPDTEPPNRSGADGDPGSNRPADRNPEQHQPDEHGKQVPDERPRGADASDSERPRGNEAESESVSARRDPEDSSHPATAAADSTAAHGKTDGAPDPAASGHKDAPGSDSDTTHKSNDGDTGDEHADSHNTHDGEPDGSGDRNHDDGRRHDQDEDRPADERNHHSGQHDGDDSSSKPPDTTHPGDDPLSGPVTFKAPPDASPAEVQQVRDYVDGCNRALDADGLSETGRVSTEGSLSRAAVKAAKAERALHPDLYKGKAVGHVPDTTWTADPIPHEWQAMSKRVNGSLGGQAGWYPIGYKPTEFRFDEGE